MKECRWTESREVPGSAGIVLPGKPASGLSQSEESLASQIRIRLPPYETAGDQLLNAEVDSSLGTPSEEGLDVLFEQELLFVADPQYLPVPIHQEHPHPRFFFPHNHLRF